MGLASHCKRWERPSPVLQQGRVHPIRDASQQLLPIPGIAARGLVSLYGGEGIQQLDNSLCWRGHVAGHVTRCCFCRGPYPSVLPALCGFSGAGPSPLRQPASWPEITSTNLPGRGGSGFAFIQISHVFLTSRRSTGKVFSCVWLSVGGSRLTVQGPSEQPSMHEKGSQYPGPPHPTSPATSPQHNHLRSHTVGVIHSVPRLL